MAFCHNCGVKLLENADFCHNCGAPAMKQPPRADPPRQNTQQPRQTPYGYRPNLPPWAPTQRPAAPTQTAPKRKGKLGLRLVALLLAVALGVTGFWQPGFILNAILGDGETEATAQPGTRPSGTKPQADPDRPQSSSDWQALLSAEELAAGQARGLSAEVPDVPKLGSSKPIDAEPLAGFHVTAAAEAYKLNAKTTIEKNGKYHVDFVGEGAYTELP